MNSSNCSSLRVHELFQSLLAQPTPSNSTATSCQRPTAPQQSLTSAPQQPLTSAPQQPLTSPPAKNSIRYIDNDQNNRREKYDGYRWRLVCTWNINECKNVVYAHQLCCKHNALRRNKELPKKKRKPLITHLSLPIKNQYNHNYPPQNNDDDDDIEILEDYCKSGTTRHSMNSNIKTEASDFNIFSVEHLNEADLIHTIKSEPRASSYYPSTSSNDVEFISSKTRNNGLNIAELMSKNIPPLTDFEEDYIVTRLIERYPRTCLMLDAQLFVHNEALSVVKRNYRLKMDTIAPEYFYDFLLRHPHVPIHYSNWFLRCKPSPPTTGCSIDTKIWTLSMAVRGATKSDNMNDECNE